MPLWHSERLLHVPPLIIEIAKPLTITYRLFIAIIRKYVGKVSNINKGQEV